MPSKCGHCEEGLPEWVMSYADMITILMAFFVVMYSMAGKADDAKKEEAVMQSLRDRFGPNISAMNGGSTGSWVKLDSAFARIMMRGSKPGKGRGDGDNKGGVDAAAPVGQQKRVTTVRPGEQASLGALIVFDEASTDLKPEHKKQLQFAAEEFNGKPHKIEVRGHTSRRPIAKGQPYRDNWDLAYARCRATMDELVSRGVDPRRIRLGVAADNEPPVNDGDELRRLQAARVEVFMLNEIAAAGSERVPKSAK